MKVSEQILRGVESLERAAGSLHLATKDLVFGVDARLITPSEWMSLRRADIRLNGLLARIAKRRAKASKSLS